MAIHTNKPVRKIFNFLASRRSGQFSIFNSKKGFTLIELIIVFSVMAILSTIGIAALVGYSRIQALQSEELAFATMLQVAKSRAQSQVTTVNGQPVCQNSSLTGYQVSICKIAGVSTLSCSPQDDQSQYDYALYAVCGGNLVSPTIEGKKFSNDQIAFTNDSTTSFLFNTISGGVFGATKTGSTVTLSGYGATKTITIYGTGRIDAK